MENGEFITTSYEHDEYGATSEEPENKKLMNDKRFKKLDTFVQQEFTKDFYGYDIINPEAKIFFVTFGMNRYVLEEYIRIQNAKCRIQN
jgi:2-oxoglutarate ferredoxin oxidoreductase subunit alpha